MDEPLYEAGDKENEYVVSELQEYTQIINDTFEKSNPNQTKTAAKASRPAESSFQKVLKLFLVAVLVTVLILILILQCVTVYDLRTRDPAACEETTTSDTLTGNNNNACSCNGFNSTTVDPQLLNRILSLSDMQAMYIQNNTATMENTLKTVLDSATKLTGIIGTLSSTKGTGITTEALVNDILSIVKEVLKIQNSTVTLTDLQPSSCEDIKSAEPNSSSGYYHIHSQIVYCEMGEVCGSDDGWAKLGYLDMTDVTVDCPTGFRLYEVNGVRACGRPFGGPSCPSIKFPSNGISYSEVCGRVVGYQYASPDAVDTRFVGPDIYNDINSYYADGVSITQGFPRKHIWTYLAGVSDTLYDAGNCPCNDPPGGTQLIRPFMGDDYFCESGNPAGWTYKLYTDDPLWDGDGCGSQEGPCCSVPGQPWFHKTLNTTSTDYIELRVCGDENTKYDDVPVSFYEIFVK